MQNEALVGKLCGECFGKMPTPPLLMLESSKIPSFSFPFLFGFSFYVNVNEEEDGGWVRMAFEGWVLHDL